MYTTIRIPKELAKSVALIRRDLAKSYSRIPKYILSPEKCPRCGGKFEVVSHVKSGVEIVKCRRCGYAQPRVSIETKGIDLVSVLLGSSLGILAGFGIAALTYIITSERSFWGLHEKFENIVVESDRDVLEEFIKERR